MSTATSARAASGMSRKGVSEIMRFIGSAPLSVLMIETIRRPAGLNSGACCQIEKLSMAWEPTWKGPSAWPLGPSRSLAAATARRSVSCLAIEDPPATNLGARSEMRAARGARTSFDDQVCRHYGRMRDGLLRSGGLDQPKLGQ